jgi:CRP-like cAMP-binding protein
LPQLADGEYKLNKLLAAIPLPKLEPLAREFERVELSLQETLIDLDEEAGHVYFPLGGVVSLLAVMADGASGEVGIVGSEGMVGLAALLGGDSMPVRAIVQAPGAAVRAPARTFRLALSEDGLLRGRLDRYTQAMMTQIAQTAVCNRLHPTEERAARWILMTHDRVGDGSFPMTQEFLGHMLGVRRATVTIAAGMLRAAGLISYQRGTMRVLDRDALEEAACECYGVVRREYDRLLR